MIISRREFFRAAAGMAGVLGLQSSGLLKLQEVLAGSGNPSVIWLQGQSCTGCSISFLNSVYYATVDTLLLDKINLEYHPNVMAPAGNFAISAAQVARPSTGELIDVSGEWAQKGQNLNMDLNGDGIVNFVDYALLAKRGYILVVEGAIPTGAGGEYCEIGGGMTMLSALGLFAKYASAVIAVGTCAAFGGIPASGPNPTGAMGVSAALKSLNQSKSVINIPGCPIHPDWLVGTIVSLLTGAALPLDSQSRPTAYFGTLVHTACPYLSSFNSSFSGRVNHGDGRSCLSCHSRTDGEVSNPRTLGASGCLFALGCKGRQTYCDCPTRKWNSPAAGQTGVNWCVQAGSPCIGCTEPTFPDSMTPFYTLNGSGAEGDDD
jgi:hydrogenase small subunit